MQFSKVTIALLAAFTSFVAAQEATEGEVAPVEGVTGDAGTGAETTEETILTAGEGEQVAEGEQGGETPPTETPEGSTMVHVITVGNAKGEPVFEPNNIQAKVGDMVQFHFYPSNHSVVMSAFDKPCQPNDDAAAFYTGFMPVKVEDTEMPIYSVPITDDSKPIWFYCSQGKHCQNGMVGVINQKDEEKTIEKYAEACKGAPENVTPGRAPSGGEPGSEPEGGDSNQGGDASTTLATATATSGNSQATSSNVAPTNAGSKLATSSAAIFFAALVSSLLI